MIRDILELLKFAACVVPVRNLCAQFWSIWRSLLFGKLC